MKRFAILVCIAAFFVSCAGPVDPLSDPALVVLTDAPVFLVNGGSAPSAGVELPIGSVVDIQVNATEQSNPGMPEDAQIRYTTDGSDPAPESTLFNGSFTLQVLSLETQVRARIFDGQDPVSETGVFSITATPSLFYQIDDDNPVFVLPSPDHDGEPLGEPDIDLESVRFFLPDYDNLLVSDVYMRAYTDHALWSEPTFVVHAVWFDLSEDDNGDTVLRELYLPIRFIDGEAEVIFGDGEPDGDGFLGVVYKNLGPFDYETAILETAVVNVIGNHETPGERILVEFELSADLINEFGEPVPDGTRSVAGSIVSEVVPSMPRAVGDPENRIVYEPSDNTLTISSSTMGFGGPGTGTPEPGPEPDKPGMTPAGGTSYYEFTVTEDVSMYIRIRPGYGRSWMYGNGGSRSDLVVFPIEASGERGEPVPLSLNDIDSENPNWTIPDVPVTQVESESVIRFDIESASNSAYTLTVGSDA